MNNPIPAGFRMLPSGGIVGTPRVSVPPPTVPDLMLNTREPVDDSTVFHQTPQMSSDDEPDTFAGERTDIQEDASVPIPVDPADVREGNDFVYVPIPKKLACIAGVAAPIFIVIQAGMTGYDLFKQNKSS
jgi:hypothetical protein